MHQAQPLRGESGKWLHLQQQSWNTSSSAALLSQQGETKSPAQRLPQTRSLQLPFLHCRDLQLSCLIQHPQVKGMAAPEGDCPVTKPVPTSTSLCSAQLPVGPIYQILYISPRRIPASPFSLQNFWEALLRCPFLPMRGRNEGKCSRNKYFLKRTQSSRSWHVPTAPSA